MPLRERRGRWHYRFDLHGREYSGSTNYAATSQNRALAETVEFQARAQAAIAHNWKERVSRFTPMLIRDAVARWLEACRPDYTARPASWKRLCVSGARFIEAFGPRLVFEVAAAEAESFKLGRLAAGRSNNTVRNDLHAVSLFFQYAVRQGWCSDSPVSKVRKPPAKTSRPFHVLTAGEEAAYFAAAASNPNLFDVARLMLLAGARSGELLNLRARDFDAGRGTVAIREGKTPSARRTLLLVPEARLILSRRADGLHADSFLFPGRAGDRPALHMNNAHQRALARAGGLRFRIYDMRHTFASRAAARGMPLTTLAAILGHASLRCVMIYVHPSQADMDRAMLRFGEGAAA